MKEWSTLTLDPEVGTKFDMLLISIMLGYPQTFFFLYDNSRVLKLRE